MEKIEDDTGEGSEKIKFWKVINKPFVFYRERVGRGKDNRFNRIARCRGRLPLVFVGFGRKAVYKMLKSDLAIDSPSA